MTVPLESLELEAENVAGVGVLYSCSMLDFGWGLGSGNQRMRGRSEIGLQVRIRGRARSPVDLGCRA